MSPVKIGVSRHVAIPKKLHDRLGLAPGDSLQVELQGDRLILTPKA
jgi:AbrB family looped-hinge helix DNA binding protein